MWVKGTHENNLMRILAYRLFSINVVRNYNTIVCHAVGLFHWLSLPDSPVVSTPIYVLSAAYNRISQVHPYNKLQVTSLAHETIYTE